MIIAKYTVKFEELVIFFPQNNGVVVEGSKCIKFESVLHYEINKFIGYQKIRQLFMLVNKCRIYDEDCRARYAHYKRASDKKSGSQFRGKPYLTLDNKGKQKLQ